MIIPRETQTVAAVAAHYDSLDRFYREIWGEHVHHGLWRTGAETPEQATRALAELVIARAGVRPGSRVIDVGCGYGGTSRLLAKEHGAEVVGYSVSEKQLEHARSLDSFNTGNPRYVLGDFLENRLEAESADAVISIESSEHFADKARLFREAQRILRPGGRFVVAAWIAQNAPSRWRVDHLLEPICREGRLPGMGDEQDYRRLMAEAQLSVDGVDDLSANVSRTWVICLERIAKNLASSAEHRRMVLQRGFRDRVFLVTMARILAAYKTGAMRYLIFAATRR